MAVIICSSNEEGPLRCETKRVFCCHTPLFWGASPLSVGLQIINPATVDSPKGNNRMGDDISFFSGILPSAGLIASHPEVFSPMVKEILLSGKRSQSLGMVALLKDKPPSCRNHVLPTQLSVIPNSLTAINMEKNCIHSLEETRLLETPPENEGTK